MDSIKINEEAIKLAESIKEARKKDGYIVTHKFTNKYTLEEIIQNVIKSHT